MSNETLMPSYKKGLGELQEQLKGMLPADALNVFDKDATQLAATHQDILRLTKGDKAPDFALTNAVGETVRLAELLEKGKVVLTFYRGTWCPYCNLQLNQYQQSLAEIHELGAQLVAVSPQTPDESMNMKAKNDLQFEVLSDNGNLIARQYTTVFKNGQEPLDAMKKLGIDFDSHYADDSQELPVPAVFIIEQDHSISFAKAVDGDYRNRVEATDILAALKR